MQIKVLINYGGTNTNERRIVPGVYALDDPALFGVGSYLLSTGQAAVVEIDPPPVPDEVDVPPVPDEVDEVDVPDEVDEVDVPDVPDEPPKKRGGK